MKTLSMVVALTVGALYWCGAQAQETCVRVEEGKPLVQEPDGKFQPPQGAVRLVIHLPGANVDVPGEVLGDLTSAATMKPLSDFTPPSDFIEAARNGLTARAADRGRARIAYVDAKGSLQTANGGQRFFLAKGESGDAAKRAACGAGADGGGAAGQPALAEDCKVVAADRNLGNRPFEAWILFNSAGAVCYAPYPLRQRDRIHFGMVWMQGEEFLPGVSANVTNCTRPTPAPSIFASGEVPSRLITQAGPAQPATRKVSARYELREIAAPVECASGDPQIAVSVPAAGGTATARPHTLNLFERYTAVFHVGALNSRLRGTDFGLQTVNGTNTIVNREATDRGPEYVATIVVQALPRYFTSGKGAAYPGRDLLHDNDWQDRVGLAFAFGLRDPLKRFGVGVSFEVVRGVNVAAIYEWVKRTQLSGVVEGSVFTGAANQIPTRKEWDRGTSIGLTFDIAYITRAFGTGK